jgi:hypothetical protein
MGPEKHTGIESDDEERRLLDQYNRAAAEYSALIVELADRRWSKPEPEYLRVYGESEKARLHCEAARLNLEAFRQLL